MLDHRGARPVLDLERTGRRYVQLEPVLIQVGNLFNAPNSGDLEITLLPPPPASDDCAAPIQISGIGSTPYSRTGLTSSGFDGGNPAACSQGTAGPVIRDLFFAWTALADGSYRFLSCGEMGSVVLTAHQGSDCSATCITDSIGYPCSFAGEEVLMHGVLTGDMVLLQLGDWDSFAVYPTGGILEVETAPLPPTNDACSSPTAASGLGSFPYDSSTSTDSGFDGNGAAPCVGVNHNRDVFFVWTATANGDFQFDTVGTSANTRMSIYDGADCSATCIDFDEDSADGVSPRIDLMGMIAGDTVLVQIGGWNASSVGPGALNVSIPLPPSTNDTCATAETLSGVGSFPYDPDRRPGRGAQPARGRRMLRDVLGERPREPEHHAREPGRGRPDPDPGRRDRSRGRSEHAHHRVRLGVFPDQRAVRSRERSLPG